MTQTRFRQYQLATNETFRGIVEAACMNAANQVINEDTGTPGHEQRVALAMTFILPEAGNRDEYLTRFVWQAAMDPTIQAEATAGDGALTPENVTDSSVDYLVASLWDRLAGVRPEEPDSEVGSLGRAAATMAVKMAPALEGDT